MRNTVIIGLIAACLMLIGCTQSETTAPAPGLPAEPEKPITQETMPQSPLQLSVEGFENGAPMPARFATVGGGGENISPAVRWQPLPAAQSYALLMDDKHPVANHWVHWLVADIPNTVTEIAENATRVNMPEGSRELMTSWGKTGYDGPQPPVGSGNHEYVFTVFALDVPKLDLTENVTRAEFLKAIENHTIVEESYSGFFERR